MDTNDRAKPPAGVSAIVLEMYAMAKDAKDLAQVAKDMAQAAQSEITTHAKICELQNIQMLGKLETQEGWRKDDEKFQRRVLVSVIALLLTVCGSVVAILVGIVLKSIHLS